MPDVGVVNPGLTRFRWYIEIILLVPLLYMIYTFFSVNFG